jgi:hypothetical protein
MSHIAVRINIDPALELADGFLITHRGSPIPVVPLYAFYLNTARDLRMTTRVHH